MQVLGHGSAQETWYAIAVLTQHVTTSVRRSNISNSELTWPRLFLLPLPFSDQRRFGAPTSAGRCLTALLLSMITCSTLTFLLSSSVSSLITYAVSLSVSLDS